MDRGGELGLHRCPLSLPSPCVPGHACDADAEERDRGGFRCRGEVVVDCYCHEDFI
jgi:hypothetical protein